MVICILRIQFSDNFQDYYQDNKERYKLEVLINLLNTESPTGVIITTDHERDLRTFLNPLLSDLYKEHRDEKKEALMRLQKAGIFKNGKFNLRLDRNLPLDWQRMKNDYCYLLKMEKQEGIKLVTLYDRLKMWGSNFDPAVCNEINLLP